MDTHGQTHHAAVIDHLGRHLADREFLATGTGYRHPLCWLRSFGTVAAVGVEGTGAYGAELARTLRRAGLRVVEVDRPDRRTRRMKGKSDPIDAYAAAQAVASGRASGTPKTREGIVEAIRTLRVVRRSAVKSRTQAVNQARQLLVTAPEALRAQLRGLSAGALAQACARLRPGGGPGRPGAGRQGRPAPSGQAHPGPDRRGRRTARTAHGTDRQAAPDLPALKGVGADVAGQLLATAGDNPDRLHSKSAFAHLCGVAPIPASSGRRDRHRLNRGGDRATNHALHTIVLSRMRWDERTRAYIERRTTEGLATKDIMRCLKRHIAREVYRVLPRATRTPDTNRPTQSDLTEAA